jgi:tRNA (cytidine/uridine-2'-O-)-methyltransferase
MSAIQPPQIVRSAPDPRWGTAQDPDLHLVLVQPEIPANTGNIARLCAATGAVLHLVEPLGFVLEDRYLKRAGLDYWPSVTLCVHADWEALRALFPPARLHLMTTRGDRPYTEGDASPGSVYVMGAESRGLDAAILAQHPGRLFRIPIRDDVRSLNIANASALVLYDALRRRGWPGMR